eukprot:CAMPEP_0183721180 /NCGR_PEP_ID=MMETSP0737-20130205/13547_1 /TAXON_ID=385413 /ORGANISM="Thalassiosira miniscula, Strain CCMP1093" /LENGTH=428 /DNA_ID=CAMNT_0025951151 /DNA_START=44 /DNA_END=1330 /DNA_ORIENTATION=+
MSAQTPLGLAGDLIPAPHFLNGDDPSPGNDEGGYNADHEEEANQRPPLQLPRVGWDTDDDEGGGSGAIHHQDLADVHLPSSEMKYDDGDVVSLRSMSRSSEAELAPIPEDISMHGAWPDYYPDMLGCYDYDRDQRKYQYRRCGNNRQRICGVLLIVFGAIIGSRVSSQMARKQRQHEQQAYQPSGDNNLQQRQPDSPNGDGSFGDAYAAYEPELGDSYQAGVDVYVAIMDTLEPIMFDDSTQWDGTYFDAFEFCGSGYNRVPCPYIAYCPLGPGSPPLGGTKIDQGDSWAPVFSNTVAGDPKHTDWVQLGSSGTCELYSQRYKGLPPWGNEIEGGEGTKDISRHVMCCLEFFDGTYKGGEDNGPSTNPDFLDRPPSLEEDEFEKPIPIRVEEEGGRGNMEQSNDSSGGNRILSSNARTSGKAKSTNNI